LPNTKTSEKGSPLGEQEQLKYPNAPPPSVVKNILDTENGGTPKKKNLA
jgi:hypothetical protein